MTYGEAGVNGPVEIVVRAAADADMPAVRRVARHFGLLDGWPADRDFLDAERVHGTLLVAPLRAGSARGFGGTLRRGDITHLGDLFVLPEHQSCGVGRALLSELLAAAGPKVTFASSDRRAVGLYVRHGMRPWCPLLYLTGPARAAGLATPPVRKASPGEVAAADAAAGGGARPGTLTWYAATPGVTAYTTGAGYAFTRVTDGTVLVGPAGGESPRDCSGAVLGALAASAATGGPPTARIAVPGVHPLVPALLGAGWRIEDMDTLMADDAALALIRPDRYIPHPDLG